MINRTSPSQDQPCTQALSHSAEDEMSLGRRLSYSSKQHVKPLSVQHYKPFHEWHVTKQPHLVHTQLPSSVLRDTVAILFECINREYIKGTYKKEPIHLQNLCTQDIVSFIFQGTVPTALKGTHTQVSCYYTHKRSNLKQESYTTWIRLGWRKRFIIGSCTRGEWGLL